MNNNIGDLVHDVVASPLGDIIASVGEGVSEAQQALDEGSLANTLELYAEGGDEMLKMLREIGYRPTFYVLPETTGEVRISMHLGTSVRRASTTKFPTSASQPIARRAFAKNGQTLNVKPRIYATPVDAGYANRYGYDANISAKLTFKIVPVPAPAGFDEIRILPNFVGKTIAESLILADTMDLEITIVGSDNLVIETPNESASIIAQSPQSDPITQQLIRLGEEIVLTSELL